MNLEQLRALTAIVDEGTFEAAADLLRVTPSAVSQRIKALEASVGQVVVQRSVPCVPTEAGVALVQMARQIQLLQADTLHRLGADANSRTRLPVAVNADSLATWFVPVLREAADWSDVLLDLHVEDQDHSSTLLRRGEVLGAITADPSPVHGCSIEPLGRMRYLPVASATLLERHRMDERQTLDYAALPMVQYNAKDDLQRQALRTVGIQLQPPAHIVPSFDGFFSAIHAGLGWGMVTEYQWQQLPDDDSLVRLPDLPDADVALYWQSWTLRSDRLDRLRSAVRSAASAGLYPSA
ncbi:LysR family transcriptional regulator ArgP [Micrococcus terreus]|uniref:LysR family transcriptional regulator ArgP n=1 Tax=Micrococcus terreus TaxID=574650 RepID=UPI0023FA2F6C|nr:LysR family transcriptional regulator ArgP [Micrococcus terreus]